MTLDARREGREGRFSQVFRQIGPFGLDGERLLRLGPSERRQEGHGGVVELCGGERRQRRGRRGPHVPATAGELPEQREGLAGAGQPRQPPGLTAGWIDRRWARGLREHVGKPRRHRHAARPLVDHRFEHTGESVDDRHPLQITERHEQVHEKTAPPVVVERIDHDEHRWSVAEALLLKELDSLERRRCGDPCGHEHEHGVGMRAGGKDRFPAGRDAHRLIAKPRDARGESVNDRGIGVCDHGAIATR